MSEAGPSTEATRTKAQRAVSSLSPAQLERKREHDRESQRAARDRTRRRIESLEEEVRQLRLTGAENMSRDANTIEELRWRNKLLQDEVNSLKEYLRSVSRTASPFYASDGSGLLDTNPAPVILPSSSLPGTELWVNGDRFSPASGCACVQPSPLTSLQPADFESLLSSSAMLPADICVESRDEGFGLGACSVSLQPPSQYIPAATYLPANSLPVANHDILPFHGEPVGSTYTSGEWKGQLSQGRDMLEDCGIDELGQYQNTQPENS